MDIMLNLGSANDVATDDRLLPSFSYLWGYATEVKTLEEEKKIEFAQITLFMNSERIVKINDEVMEEFSLQFVKVP
ncbi:hypothetical protein scyTo_0007117 [Scyliorhinus torazame]|uniref:Uncharacterized protein n=1 Tax=Scyliorhinus torazame TaxID=75743 RepID=A0A401NLT7_SCYTO|nr:hypothetical protein [Scyliorhinus torazame]